MKSKILLNQLQKLWTAHFKTVGDVDITLPFDEVVFCKKESVSKLTKIVFENYIVNPFNGFDFHDKWNDGIPPPCTTMYGEIDNETKGMYHFVGKSESGDLEWEGWVPKKSCTVKEI